MPNSQSCYVTKVEQPLNPRVYAQSVYDQADEATVRNFMRLNRVSGQDYLRPGQTLILPMPGEMPGAHMTSVSEHIGPINPIPQSTIDAQRFNQNYDLLDFLANGKDAMGFAGDQVGGVAEYMSVRTDMIRRDFNKLAEVYKDAHTRDIKFQTEKFRSLRSPIERKLQAQLTGLARSRILQDPGAKNLKKGFRLNTRSIAKDLTLNPNKNPKAIAKGFSKIDDFAGTVKRAGTIGKVISVGATFGEIADGFKESNRAGSRAIVTEGASWLGSAAAGAAATKVVLALGIATGGTGFIVLGLAVVVSSAVAGIGSEAVAGGAFDFFIKP
ncbi:MAG: hypothetical protein AAF127_12540 [Pseudomonadota bacterium]